MKALTVLQPWASLIASGAKRIETRSWPTHHRGKLAIHAGARRAGKYRDLCLADPFRKHIDDYNALPFGAVVAIVELVDVVPVADVKRRMHWYQMQFGRDDAAFGNFAPGRYAWILGRVVRIPPQPALGTQMLWDWIPSKAIASALRRQRF